MRRRVLMGFTVLAAFVLVSCATTGPSGPEAVSPPIHTRTVTGTVDLPDGAAPDASDLTVLSFAGEAPVGQDGTFSLVVPETDLPQVLLVLGEGTSPVLLGYVTAAEVDVVVDASSTALALVLLNPFTAMFSAADRSELVAMIESKDWWPELVEWTEDALARSRSGRIDGQAEPALLQLASGLAIDVLNDWPSGSMSIEGPWLSDGPGDAIDIVNPGATYGAATFRSGPGDSVYVLLDSDRSEIRIHPAWPPFPDMMSRTTTRVDVGEGTFVVSFTRGDMTSLDASTANGAASLWNASRALTELLALATGVTYCPDPAELGLEAADFHLVASRLRACDTIGLVRALLELMEEQPGEISTWFWEEDLPEAELYVETISPLLSGIMFSTSVLAPEETRVPFYCGLTSGSGLDSRSITNVDGHLTETGSNYAPRARFTVTPPGSQPGALLVFDASESFDPGAPTGALEYRWDWENDGAWDTTWSTVDVIGHGFADAGAREVTLQVRDRSGMSDTEVHVVNIGGAEEGACHIVVLRDATPWAGELSLIHI